MQRFDEENRYPEVNGSPCRVSEKTRDANPGNGANLLI